MDKDMKMNRFTSRALVTGTTLGFLVGCSSTPWQDYSSPLDQVGIQNAQQESSGVNADQEGSEVGVGSSSGPQLQPLLSPPAFRSENEFSRSGSAPSLAGEPISVSFDSVPITEFIEAVFGQILGVTYEISDDLTRRQQLVTLRTAEALPRDDFYQLVVQVLNSYDATVLFQGGAYRVVSRGSAPSDIPQVIRARAFPNVPSDMRPVFFSMKLYAVDVERINTIIGGTVGGRVNLYRLPNSNDVVMLGPPNDVAAVADMVRMLDQPDLAGQKSYKIEPVFWTAQALADRLKQVLELEGYSVSIGTNFARAITFLPIPELNQILLFTPTQEVAAHVLNWAQELDQPAKTLSRKGIFYLPIKNTSAVEVSGVLGTLLEVADVEGEGDGSVQGEVKVIVDATRNALVVRGTAEQYAQVRSLVEQVDRAPLQVLIEATVAEVTLTDDVSLGIDWAFNENGDPGNSLTVEGDSTGLRFSIVRDMGRLSANLNALAQQERVAILSSPRLITTSGKEASIQAGNQIPVITTRQTADGTTGGSSNLLQEVQYRSTGVNLNVTPTINSANRVELEVTQSVDEAQSNNTSSIDSPIILTRSVSTSLSIEDGETVLLGGLISENRSSTDSGVPLLKDIPFIGNAFKSRSESLDKTELIILLTPYIIDDTSTGRTIRDAFRNQLSDWGNADREPQVSAPPIFTDLLQ